MSTPGPAPAGALAARVAVVTGASAGIGTATARALAAAGATVVLAARRSERIAALAAELTTAHHVPTLAVPTDMSRRDEVDALLARAAAAFGRVDILINNAGLGLQGDAAELPEQELRYLFDVNFFGPVFAMQAAIPHMRTQRGGVIVNISSILARAPLPSLGMVGSSAGYSASKAALQAFSSAARMELAAANIRVITVLPGVTASEFNDAFLTSSARAGRSPRRSGSLMGVTPAEVVGKRIVRAIEHSRQGGCGEREVYITWKDRLFVWGATAAPGPFEWAMRRLRAKRLSAGGPRRADELRG